MAPSFKPGDMNRKIRRSFYILDIEPGATPEQIKASYLLLVKIWHPDRCGDDPDLAAKASEKMKEINHAYDEVKAWIEAQERSGPRRRRTEDESRDTETDEEEETFRRNEAPRPESSRAHPPHPGAGVRGVIHNRIVILLALGAAIVVSFYVVSDSVREWASTPPPQHAGQAEYNQTLQAVFRKTYAEAEKGERWAQGNLATMYFEGRGVPTNRLEAIKWFRKAAEQGDVNSMTALARCFHTGDGVPLDYAAAVLWFQRAAEQGDAAAQEQLGQCFMRGEGVAADFMRAYFWLTMAAAQGRSAAAATRDDVFLRMTREQQEVAQQWVAERAVKVTTKTPAQDALARYRAAAEKGDRAAQNQLGVACQTGNGVPQNLAEAARWYRLAAEQGDPYAQSNLAGLFATGYGVAEDLVEAYKWWNLAAAQGHRTAGASRDALLVRMKPEQILEAQRRSTEFMQQKLPR